MRLRRSSRRHKTAVDSTLWYDFNPGDRVLTVEGIYGRVVAVEDGHVPGDEQYIVELELGLGGGEYSAGELTKVEGGEAKTASRPTSINDLVGKTWHALRGTKYHGAWHIDEATDAGDGWIRIRDDRMESSARLEDLFETEEEAREEARNRRAPRQDRTPQGPIPYSDLWWVQQFNKRGSLEKTAGYEAEVMAEWGRLQNAHSQLYGWTLVFERGRASAAAGTTFFNENTIKIAPWAVEQLSLEKLIDTVRHEAAHVLAGVSAGHGPEWKRMCRVTGADPSATFDAEGADPGYKWVAMCPNHGQMGGWFRRPSRDFLCNKCDSQVEVVPKTALKIAADIEPIQQCGLQYVCPVCAFEAPTDAGLDLHWVLVTEAEKGGGPHLNSREAALNITELVQQARMLLEAGMTQADVIASLASYGFAPYIEVAEVVKNLITGAKEAELEGHVASEDYPELAEILIERPPLPHSERVAARIAAAAWSNGDRVVFGDEDNESVGTIVGEGSGGSAGTFLIQLDSGGQQSVSASDLRPVGKTADLRVQVWWCDEDKQTGASRQCNEDNPCTPECRWVYPDELPSKTAYEGEGRDDVNADLNLAWRKGREDGALGREPNAEGMSREEREAYFIGYEEGDEFGLTEATLKTASYVIVDDGGFIVAGPFVSRARALEELEYLREDDEVDAYQLVLERVAKQAGILDRVVAPVADYMIRNQNPDTRYNFDTGQMASYDWCRFRRDRRCYYPKKLNEQATQQAGYPVWVPEDRGFCPYDKWSEQKTCPAPSEPGPNANDPRNLTDATFAWEEGGQRYDSSGRPIPVRIYSRQPVQIKGAKDIKTIDSVEEKGGKPTDNDPLAEDLAEMVEDYRKTKDDNPYSGGNPYMATRDPEFAFHFTSKWADVQEKASRIRQNGHVRIISASPAYLVGEVQGDTDIYRTTLHRDASSNAIAMWECGCAWAAYSWGRSGRWKKYEGRMCSHALALNYEGQSRGWQGKEISEDRSLPQWRSDPSLTVKVPGDYKRPDYEWRVDASKTAGPNAPTFEGNYVVIDPKKQAHILDPYIWGANHVNGDIVRRTVQRHKDGDGSPLRTTCCGKQVRATWQTFGLVESYDDAQWYTEDFTSVCPGIQRTALRKGAPFAGYEDFDACVAANQDKDDPEAYCGKIKHQVEGMKPVSLDPSLRDAPAVVIARSMYREGDSKGEIAETLLALGVSSPGPVVKEAMAFKEFTVRWKGLVHKVLDVLPDGLLRLDTGEVASPDDVQHPNFHPTRGLEKNASVPEKLNWDQFPRGDTAGLKKGDRISITLKDVTATGIFLSGVGGNVYQVRLDGTNEEISVPGFTISKAAASNRVCDWCGRVASYAARPSGDEGLMPSETFYACEDHKGELEQYAGEIRSIGSKVARRWVDEEEAHEDPDSSMWLNCANCGENIGFIMGDDPDGPRGWFYEYTVNDEGGEPWCESCSENVPYTASKTANRGGWIEGEDDSWSYEAEGVGEGYVHLDWENEDGWVYQAFFYDQLPYREEGKVSGAGIEGLEKALRVVEEYLGDYQTTMFGSKTAGFNRTYRELVRDWHIRALRHDGGVDEMLILTGIDNYLAYGKVEARMADGTERSWTYAEWVDEYEGAEVISKRGDPSMFKTAQADSVDGCMIALRPPDDILSQVHIEGEEPFENLHLTVAYMGKSDEIDRNALEEAVADWVSRWGPQDGQLSGYGVFENGDERVLYSSIDLPGFEDARADLLEILARYGLEPKRDHGFTPHMTLAYGDDFTVPEAMPEEAKTPFVFDAAYVVYGPEWVEAPFVGRGVMKAIEVEAAEYASGQERHAPGVSCPFCGAEDQIFSFDHDEQFSHFECYECGNVFDHDDINGGTGTCVKTGKRAELKDVPEPALPETTAEEEDDDFVQVEPDLHTGSIQPGDASLSWLMNGNSKGGGPTDSDIANAAKEALKKMALKDFTPAEQKQLIDEGEGVTAANLDRLDIAGTHYEALESAFSEEDESENDDVWMAL